jgi:hypothetical protein
VRAAGGRSEPGRLVQDLRGTTRTRGVVPHSRTGESVKNDHESLWDVDGVCDYLGIDAVTAAGRRHALSRLGVPVVHIGGRLRFVPADVRAWVERQKVTGTRERG